jgi:hypothetical protein
MAYTTFDLPKPTRTAFPVGFGSADASVGQDLVERLQRLRRRREILEAYFSPVVSAAALPSAVDRLVLWRSHHGRHHT